MPSLAERTRISEQETTPGHSLSTASLMVSMYLKFLKPKLLSCSCSDKLLLVDVSNKEASQLYNTTKRGNKTKPLKKKKTVYINSMT